MSSAHATPPVLRTQVSFTPESAEEKLYELFKRPYTFFDLVRPVNEWERRNGYRFKGTLQDNHWLTWAPGCGLISLWVEEKDEQAVLAAKSIGPRHPLAKKFMRRLGFHRIIFLFVITGLSAVFFGAAGQGPAAVLVALGAAMLAAGAWQALAWRQTEAGVHGMLTQLSAAMVLKELEKSNPVSILERHRMEVMERIKKEKENAQKHPPADPVSIFERRKGKSEPPP